MFTSNAELNGIVDNEKDSSLAVTNAIQKTYIDVNEHGVEAAATTSNKVYIVMITKIKYYSS